MVKFLRKKIIIALSGGVDSAVSAALLKKQGFDVSGVFFLFFGGKGAKSAAEKAKAVAMTLEIPFQILDFRSEFRRKVIGCFIEGYKNGITPNPCVVCNKEMKFRILFETLKKEKADFVATGHYARLLRKNDKISEVQDVRLLEAKDKLKDQSYFLYRLRQKDLQRMIFPLGEYKKSDVKKLAKKFRLPVPENEESQDICFLAGTDLNQFLRKNIEPKKGNIVDEKGSILAKHKGLPFYTIGQRKGIEIGGTGPYFVIGKNSKKNQLIVSNDPKKLLAKKFLVSNANWVKKDIELPLRAQTQIRYHAAKIPAIIRSGKRGIFEVETAKPLRAVTPGQSAVFYAGAEVLGGGIII